MTDRQRLARTLRFEKPDRMPIVEWATWWTLTLDRWRTEGLPETVKGNGAIRAYFGHDCWQQLWLTAKGRGLPAPKYHGAPLISSMEEYEAALPCIYPEPNLAKLRAWKPAHERGDTVVWITLEGFFWWPRVLLGIEPHLYSFYDKPELYHRICADLLSYHKLVMERVYDILTPDFMTYAEDMSYNHGPMISQGLFNEFLKPYYEQSIPLLRNKNVPVFLDTDGDVTTCIGWYRNVGVQGLLPLERMAGVDVSAIRQTYPDLLMIGAFDKTIMHLGEQRMRQEFERLLPVMRQGGYVASCDHQTPPGVSLSDYRLYLRLLREYAEKAAI